MRHPRVSKGLGGLAASRPSRLRLPLQKIQHPFPGCMKVLFHRRRGRSRSWKYYRLAAIGSSELFEDPALLFHPSIIGKKPQTVLQRVECELSIHIVAIPIGEPAYARLDGSRDGGFQSFRLLLFRHRLNASIELSSPNRLLRIARVRADQSCQGDDQPGAGWV